MKNTISLLLCGFCFLSAWAKNLTPDEYLKDVRFISEKYNGDRYYSDSNWFVWAIFFDIDNDGKMNSLLATAMDDSRDGCGWRSVFNPTNGPAYEISCDVYAYESVELFVLESKQSAPLLVKCGNLYTKKDAQGIPQYEDNFIVLTTNKQEIVCESMTGGIEEWICKPRFRRLSRAPLSKYEGYNLHEKFYSCFTPLPTHETENVTSSALQNLIKSYREDIKAKFNLSGKVTVYTISFDADNDGDEDVYISSYPEKIQGDRLTWHLYLNEEGVYRRATRRCVSHRTILDPEEVAVPTAFYKVTFSGKSRKPVVFLFDNKNGKGLTYSYLKLISKDDHAKRPKYEGYGDKEGQHALEEWKSTMKHKIGHPVPKTIREMLSGSPFKSLERIPCRVNQE